LDAVSLAPPIHLVGCPDTAWQCGAREPSPELLDLSSKARSYAWAPTTRPDMTEDRLFKPVVITAGTLSLALLALAIFTM
jgi:hypothetical protein